MKANFIASIISFLMFLSVTWAQEVSTLISDSSRRFESIHWLPDGKIFSVDFSNGRVYRIFPDGNVETLLTNTPGILGGGFDQMGNMYVAHYNDGEIIRVESDGSTETVASGFSGPIAILQDSNDPDLFYVTEYATSEVSTFNMSTGLRTAWLEDDGIFFPDGIIYGWDGEIIVANFENHKINRVDFEGNITPFADLGVSGDMGYIAIVGDYLYATSLSSNRIYRVDMDGNSEVLAGTGAGGFTDGEFDLATFTDPNGICANPEGDTLLVADVDKIRVITGFNPLPTNVNNPVTGRDVAIYPNPSKGILNVSLSENIGSQISWRVTDVSGKCLIEGSYHNAGVSLFSVDINQLDSGSYFFQIFHENGKPTSKSFVKYD
ncbi:MAG: T9SS type A sorting domain-containing protein [Flavobacteriales bacterium]|nr:T9SS type A sorting domain-containing protein [Flavobacteriales bacterium]